MVRTRANEEVGDLEDLAVDPDNGRVLYGVVDFGSWMEGEELYAIPWKALDLNEGYTHFVLNMDRAPLRNAPKFEDGGWPNLADRKLGQEVHVFYSVPVYWEGGEKSERTPRKNDNANRKNGGS